MNTRRNFLRSLGGWALVGAYPAAGQPTQVRVAWLSAGRATDGSIFLDALKSGFRELGHVEGRNFSIEPYWGDNSAPRTEKLAAEVVASKPHAIVTLGPAVLALRRLTETIPVVFGFSGDPVEAGFVDSLARPGRNFTGISFLTIELVGKRVELLKDALPRIKRVAVVANPQHPGDQAERRASQAAASALGLTLVYFEARNATELDEALVAIEKSRSDAAMLFPVQFIINNRERVAAWAIKNKIPTISGWAQFAEGGNLMTYGPNLQESFKRLAWYVDRILKGTKPSDLPVEQPMRFELVVNLKTAKALGITIPPVVMVRADRVIQ